MQHLILTLLDFSKAQDRVWTEKLLIPMLETGIPSKFIRWIRSFFSYRRASVQLFNVFTFRHRFTQGPPQGPVFALLLFLFYINNLASSLNYDEVIALFAENVSILTTAHKKEDSAATA